MNIPLIVLAIVIPLIVAIVVICYAWPAALARNIGDPACANKESKHKGSIPHILVPYLITISLLISLAALAFLPLLFDFDHFLPIGERADWNSTINLVKAWILNLWLPLLQLANVLILAKIRRNDIKHKKKSPMGLIVSLRLAAVSVFVPPITFDVVIYAMMHFNPGIGG